jgi:hypothetical protein
LRLGPLTLRWPPSSSIAPRGSSRTAR